MYVSRIVERNIMCQELLTVGRDVRQEYPLSPLLFNISTLGSLSESSKESGGGG